MTSNPSPRRKHATKTTKARKPARKTSAITGKPPKLDDRMLNDFGPQLWAHWCKVCGVTLYAPKGHFPPNTVCPSCQTPLQILPKPRLKKYIDEMSGRTVSNSNIVHVTLTNIDSAARRKFSQSPNSSRLLVVEQYTPGGLPDRHFGFYLTDTNEFLGELDPNDNQRISVEDKCVYAVRFDGCSRGGLKVSVYLRGDVRPVDDLGRGCRARSKVRRNEFLERKYPFIRGWAFKNNSNIPTERQFEYALDLGIIPNGHSFNTISQAIDEAKLIPSEQRTPRLFKWVDFMAVYDYLVDHAPACDENDFQIIDGEIIYCGP